MTAASHPATEPHTGQRLDSIWPLLVLFLLTVLAWGLAAPGIIWTSDDYALVFSLPLNPHPPLSQALRMGGAGVLSPARLLNYPFVGYLSAALGAPAVHLLAVAMHFGCGLLAFLLLGRLRWNPWSAALAAALFLVPPWVAQPVVWWSASPAAVCTGLMLLGLHAYITWRRTASPARWLWLLASMAAVLIAMLFYESWHGVFVGFWGVEFYLRRLATRQDGWLRQAARSLMTALPMLLPFVLWTIVFNLADQSRIHAPMGSPLRIAIVLLSTQLRALQWPLATHWPVALHEAAQALATPAAMLAALALIAVAIVAFRRQAYRTAAESRSTDLLGNLVLGWALFMAARVIFVLQGGVSLHTRHSYGGAIGLGIMVAAVVAWLHGRPNNGAQKLLAGAMVLSVIVLTIGSMGMSRGWAKFTQAEHTTLQAALEARRSVSGPATVVVIGKPAPDVDPTLGYFSEFDGGWLDTTLAAYVPQTQAYCVSSYRLEGNRLILPLAERIGWPYYYAKDFGKPAQSTATSQPAPAAVVEVPLERLILFKWVDGKLQRAAP